MTLMHIALQNLRRRKGKTIFLVLTFVLIIGTITALNLLAFNLKEDLQKSLSEYGANVIISPRMEHLNLSYGGLSVSGVDYEVKNLTDDTFGKTTNALGPNATVAPKVIGSAANPGKQYLIVGVDFAKELKIKPWWKINGQIPGDNQVVIGANIAAKDGLKLGDTLQLKQKAYPVIGILFETGGSEDNGVFTTFNTARELTGISNEWSLIELNVLDPDKTVTDLSKLLPDVNVSAVTQLVEGSKESVDRFASFSSSISLALGLIGILIVFTTLAGNVNERVRELAVLRAIGFRQVHILKLLGQEALIISISGSLVGYGLGVAAPLIIGPLLMQKTLSAAWHPALGFLLIFSALGTALLAMTYPAWRAVKIDLQEALRYI